MSMPNLTSHRKRASSPRTMSSMSGISVMSEPGLRRTPGGSGGGGGIMSESSSGGLRRTQSSGGMAATDRRKALTMERRLSNGMSNGNGGFGSGIRRFLRQRMGKSATNTAGVPRKNVAPRDLVRKLLETTPFSFLNQNFRSNTKEWKRFASLFEIQTFTMDDIILPEGLLCDSVYIIAEGEVSLTFRDSSIRGGRRDQFLCTKSRGDLFGISHFLSLLEESEHEPSDVTVAVDSDECTCIKLSSPNLLRFLDKHPRELQAIRLSLAFDVKNSLTPLPWVRGMRPEDLARLSHMLHFQTLARNEVLFEEGSSGREVYIVSRGEVKASSFSDEDDEKVLGRFAAGDYFGEISFACNMPRTASIIACERSLLLRLDKPDCDRFFGLFPMNGEAWDQMVKKRTAESFRKYKVPFFAAIPDDKYALLASLCTIERLERGTVVFKEGDAGTTFYLVAYGELEVTISHEHSTLRLATMSPGRYFGEIALVSNAPRSATVRALTRCVLLTISKSQFEQFFQQAPEALVDFQVKLARYDVSLKHLIYHPIGVRYFEEHLKKEFSLENMTFWKACENFSRMEPDDEEALHEEAKRLATIFLVDDESDLQVNIAEKMRTRVIEDINNRRVTSNTYGDCQNEILHLMSADSFQRFKSTKLFQDFLAESSTYISKEDKVKTAVVDDADKRRQRRRLRMSFTGSSSSMLSGGRTP